MDSAQSKRNALAFLNAHLAGDIEATLALSAPDYESVVFAPVEIFPHLGQKQGLDRLAESIRAQGRRYSERNYEFLSVIGDENEVAVVVSARQKKRSDARVVQFVSAHTFAFRDGLIWRHREFFDTFALVEQLLGADLTSLYAERLARAV